VEHGRFRLIDLIFIFSEFLAFGIVHGVGDLFLVLYTFFVNIIFFDSILFSSELCVTSVFLRL